MVIVKLNGRLGNQLFQYAIAQSLSLKYNCSYLIDDLQEPDSVIKYFDVRKSVINGKSKYLLLRCIHKFRLSNRKLAQGGSESVLTILNKFSNNRYYDGYFQSILYFDNIKDRLKDLFKIKPLFLNQFYEKYGALFSDNKTLVVHYRLSDYLMEGANLGGEDISLPTGYYDKALAQVKGISSYLTICVTDDKVGLLQKHPGVQTKFDKIISDSEIGDFLVLMHADKLIISNSTFAWWAGQLNIKNAEVIAPAHFLGFKLKEEFPKGILENNYTKVFFDA